MGPLNDARRAACFAAAFYSPKSPAQIAPPQSPRAPANGRRGNGGGERSGDDGREWRPVANEQEMLLLLNVLKIHPSISNWRSS
jgi:hypothetical protein